MIVKKFWQINAGKKHKKKSGRHYDSIDNLPYWNWDKIHKTDDYKYLIIEGEVDGLDKIWHSIFDEYIATFGLEQDYKTYLSLQKKIILLELNYAITEDRTLLNWIDILEIKLKEIRKKKNDGKIDTTVHIEKFLGFQIDEKTTSVKKYYGYIELMKIK